MADTVTFLVSTLADGGPINVLRGIVRHLDRAEFRPVIVTLSPEPAKSSILKFQRDGVEVRQLNASRTASFLGLGKRLREAVAASDTDLVHCHGIRATLLARGDASRRPLIATLHCNLSDYYRSAYGVPGRFMAHFEYRALRQYAFVAAVGESIHHVAQRHGVRSTILANGIDVAAYFPPNDEAEKRRIRTKLGLPEDKVIVLHTGLLSVGKNPVAIAEDFLSASCDRNAVLVFAGDGPLRGRCVDATGNSRRILFLGRRNDVPDLLRAADILISNSESEGLPMALLEGCASGLLVLATDIAPHREIQVLFPRQVLLFRGRPLSLLGPSVARIMSGNYTPAMPSHDSLEAISDRTMSRAYQRVYRNLIGPSRKESIAPPFGGI